MQRTIKILRIALPIVFVAFIALIALNWTRGRSRRDAGASEPVTSTQRPSDTPRAEAVTFDETQTLGTRVVSRIRAARVVSFESGWTTLEDVHLTIFRPNGLTYELVCPSAQFNSETREADARGGVRLTSSDGVEIATAQLRFDGNRLTNDIPVQFRVDRWNGNAGALDLDVGGETLRLWKKVTATMTPATSADVPMTIDGDESIFRRRENDVTFNSNVAMTRSADRLTAARMVGRFTQDRKTLLGIEGSGNVNIVFSGTSPLAGGQQGRQQITCERFFTENAPDGQIAAIVAAGGGAPAHAILDGPPRRDVTASQFRFALANRVVTEMRAEGGAVMTELAEVRREVRGDNVTVRFDPQTRRATNALIDNNFKYSDPKNQASAVQANYDIAGDRLLLTAIPGFNATVVSEGNTVKAQQIEFSPRGGTAKASGGVIAELVPKGGGPAADTTNLFPASKPVFVNSDSLMLRQANKVAVFSGNVRAWQDVNTILAQELQVQGAGQSITARGSVRTVFYNDAPDAPRRVPVVAESDQLVTRRIERRIDFLGNVKIDDQASTLTAERASAVFDANRKIERVEAENKVVMNEKASGRKGTGDKATYLVARKLVYLSGTPATATAPTGSLSGEQIVFDLSRNRVEVVSKNTKTQGSYKQ